MKRVAFFLCIGLIFSFCPERQIKWIALGDSITYLNDHPGETGNRVAKGYLTRVVEKLPRLQYVNKGYNGWTACRIAEKIDDLGIEPADIYTVFLGTNDWWGGMPVGTIADYRDNTGYGTLYGAFRVIINKLHSLNPEAGIVLMTPLQRGDFVYIGNFKNNAYGSYKAKNGQQLSDFAAAILEIGRVERIPVVDLYHDSRITQKNMVKYKRLKDETGKYHHYRYPGFVGVGFNPDTDEYPYPPGAVNMTYDGLHPSDKGNERIAGMLIKMFQKTGLF